jgi:hypothetical protein
MYSTVNVEPWITIPSTYFIFSKDDAVLVQAQDSMLAIAIAKDPKAFAFVER